MALEEQPLASWVLRLNGFADLEGQGADTGDRSGDLIAGLHGPDSHGLRSLRDAEDSPDGNPFRSPAHRHRRHRWSGKEQISYLNLSVPSGLRNRRHDF